MNYQTINGHRFDIWSGHHSEACIEKDLLEIKKGKKCKRCITGNLGRCIICGKR